MSNTIPNLSWRQLGPHYAADLEDGQLIVEYLPHRTAIRNDQPKFALYFIPKIQSETLGTFHSLDEAMQAGRAWVGDNDA